MNYEEALRYLDAGLSIVPVLPKQKKPASKLIKNDWKRFQSEQVCEDEFRLWFRNQNDLNMAVICGEVSNGLYVLDFDFDSRKTLSKWFKIIGDTGNYLPVSQTGKGYHLFFRYMSSLSSGILAKRGKEILIEIRGENSLCTLPGSMHESGKKYKWVKGALSEIPILTTRQVYGLLGGAVQLHENNEKIHVPKPVKMEGPILKCEQAVYAEAAMRAVIKELDGTKSGRNYKLNASAYRLGRFVGAQLLDRKLVEGELRKSCERNGYISKDGEGAFNATLQSGLNAGIAKPL